MVRLQLCLQVDGGGQASAVGEEGVLSGRERCTASGSGQRPLLGVGVSARYLRPAETVGLPGSPGRPGPPPRLVRSLMKDQLLVFLSLLLIMSETGCGGDDSLLSLH